MITQFTICMCVCEWILYFDIKKSSVVYPCIWYIDFSQIIFNRSTVSTHPFDSISLTAGINQK